MRTNDPLADFLRHDAQQAAELDKLPKCDYCGKPIQDEKLYELKDGCKVCPGCIEECEKWTEDYI